MFTTYENRVENFGKDNGTLRYFDKAKLWWTLVLSSLFQNTSLTDGGTDCYKDFSLEKKKKVEILEQASNGETV